MRCPECLGFGPCLEHSPVFPDGVGGVERVILSLGTFEKAKLYKARHLVEMTVAQQLDVLAANKIVSFSLIKLARCKETLIVVFELRFAYR